MKLTTLTTILAAALLPAVNALAVSRPPIAQRAALDVFVPPVTNPTAATVWTVNSTQEVTWDTSSAPVNITNRIGQIMLNKGGIASPIILASNFDILQGHVSVFVPWVRNGTDYQIVLFGDSGNFSPFFTIGGSDSLF